MKKGQGQLVAFVLLIGFTVVIGIMVGSWAVKRAGKASESFVKVGEIDVRCADTAIVGFCESETVLKIRNKGAFKVKLKSTREGVTDYVGGGDWIYPNKDSGTIALNNQNIIPFIEIEGKEYGCTSKAITITDDHCGVRVPP